LFLTPITYTVKNRVGCSIEVFSFSTNASGRELDEDAPFFRYFIASSPKVSLATWVPLFESAFVVSKISIWIFGLQFFGFWSLFSNVNIEGVFTFFALENAVFD